MKKCASCTKDLPDAALHCVFCGAKQTPSSAVQPSLAQTALGYSGNDVAAPRPRTAAPSQPPPIAQSAFNAGPAAPAFAATQAALPVHQGPTRMSGLGGAQGPTLVAGQGSSMGPPSIGGPSIEGPVMNPSMAAPSIGGPSIGGPVTPRSMGAPAAPMSNANAKTMFAPAAGPPPSPAAQLPTLVPGNNYAPAPMPAAQQATIPAPPPRPVQAAAAMPIPQAMPARYLTSQTSSRIHRPVEPWRDRLRLVMFLWGVLLLAAFATPLTVSPLAFHWDSVLHGDGLARLPPLLLGSIGLLAVLIAAIPMPSAARGALAGLLGLAGIVVPIALAPLPGWQILAPLVGTLLILPGLVLRDEYRDSLLARLLVTFGALGILAPLLVPQGGAIPLVGVFKGLLEHPGLEKIEEILVVAQLLIVVIALLAWLPAPITGGALLWAWLLILWPLVLYVTHLALGDLAALPDQIMKTPNATLIAWAPGPAYLALVGYGLASVVGKQLE